MGWVVDNDVSFVWVFTIVCLLDCIVVFDCLLVLLICLILGWFDSFASLRLLSC